MALYSQDYLSLYKDAIGKYLGGDVEVSLFWKGRVALFSILKAIGLSNNDEVILPALTCVVVPNAISYLGAKPVYVDIDPKTYNIDVTRIEEKISSKTKVIIAQNTFGLSPDLDPILAIAEKHNLKVVEDCAHGFGGFYKNQLNGTIAHASFYSTQWNKPFSTGIGGIAITRNNEITRNLKKEEKLAVKPSTKEIVSLKFLLMLRDRFLNSNTYWAALKGYRFASKHNLILGSSQGNELEKPEIPPKFLKGLSEIQAKRGVQELHIMKENLAHRKKIAQQYKNILCELGIDLPFEPEYAVHTFLKFPLLVKDRKKFFHKAGNCRIELGDWFLSPIHPVKKNFELWNYYWGENPVAEKISQHIVNLPTHPKIDAEYIDKISGFLKKTKDNIYRDFRFN